MVVDEFSVSVSTCPRPPEKVLMIIGNITATMIMGNTNIAMLNTEVQKIYFRVFSTEM